jgi:diacylglycerol kinase family enzyme
LSRQNRRDPGLTDRLRLQLGDRGTVYMTGDAASLATAIEGVLAEPVDVLAINGGDGTVHVVLTALLNRVGAAGWASLPLIQVLPGGTMNTVSGSYGVRGRRFGLYGQGPEGWLAALLVYRTAAEVPAVRRSVLEVRSGQAGAQYGFLFGNGLMSNFLELYYEGSEPTPLKALGILARGVLSAFVAGPTIRRLMRTVRVRVDADDVAWPYAEYLCVAAGTTEDVGFGFCAFFDAPRNPGRMHAVGIACSAFRLVLDLPRIWFSRPLSAAKVAQGTARTLRLQAPEAQVYMIDGDFHRADAQLTVAIGPELRFGTPGVAR